MIFNKAFGRYRLVKKLAMGGMAEVYLALRRGPHVFDRLVAIKCILPHVNSEPQHVAMFYNEARVGGLFRHPNLISVHDAEEIDARHCLVMEYVAGQTLEEVQERLARTSMRFPLATALHIIAQAARGLAHAHEVRDLDGSRLSLVHRDISPQNIMVAHDGRVKLFDFGLAVAAAHGTESRELQGKTAYMAPEQVRGRALDARSDLFSLGVVLYELVAGRKLFQRDNQMATIRAVTEDEIPAPSTLIDGLPELVDAIVLKAVSRAPDERYQSGNDLADDLMKALEAMPEAVDQRSVSQWMSEQFRNELGEVEAVVQKVLQAPEQSDATIDLSTFDVTTRANPAVTGPSPQARGIAQDEGDGLERLTGTHGLVENLPPVPATSNSVLPDEASAALLSSVHKARQSERTWKIIAALVFVVAVVGVGAVLSMNNRTTAPDAPAPGREPAQPTPAFVLVTSEPTGATVILNGQVTELRTPAQVQVTDGDAVRVEAAVDGFVTVEQQTTASASAPAVLHFALERDLTAVQNATGTLVVIYQPEDATVIVDDQPVGSQSPVRVEGISLFGDHQLRIEKLGFETHTDTFRLESADVQTMQMQLVTAQEVGTVNIRSNPAGARIYVNDEEVGVTPLEGLELVADQEYRIRLERDGATFRTRVILDPGSLQNIDGELRRAVERPRPAAPAATGPAATPEPPAAAPEPPAAPAAPAYQLLE